MLVVCNSIFGSWGADKARAERRAVGLALSNPPPGRAPRRARATDGREENMQSGQALRDKWIRIVRGRAAAMLSGCKGQRPILTSRWGPPEPGWQRTQARQERS